MSDSPTAIPGYATVIEAAKLPWVPYKSRWIKILVRDGRIEGVRVGPGRRGVWLVNLKSLRQYIEAQRQNQGRYLGRPEPRN